MNTRLTNDEILGCVFWLIVLALLLGIAVFVLSSGCCASTCDRARDVASSEDEDGGCP